MTLEEIIRVNSRLSRLTWITISGDIISLFSFATLFMANGNSLLAGLVIPIKACASIIATISFPWLINRFGARNLISVSQLIPFISSVLIAIILLQKLETQSLIGAALFIESFFSILFQTTRSSFPKFIAALCKDGMVDSKRGEQLQSSTDHAHQNGMFIGSSIFFILSYFFQVQVAFLLILNALSFLLAYFISRRIPQIPIYNRIKLLGSIEKIISQPKIMTTFFIRTFGLWVPISLFNTSMFEVTMKQYSLNPSFFSLIGVLSAIGAIYIHQKYGSDKHTFLNKFGLVTRGIIGSTMYLTSMLILSRLTNPLLGGFILVLNGAANAFLVNSSRGILWNSTTSSENSEILNLDSFCGKIIDIIVSTAYLKLAISFNLGPSTAFDLSAIWIFFMLIPAFLFLKYIYARNDSSHIPITVNATR